MADGLKIRADDEALVEAALRRFATSPAALARLAAGVKGLTSVPRGRQLLAEGERTANVTILCQGVAKCYRGLARAGQQTLALFVPGDMLDIDAFLLGRASAAVGAITPLRVAQIEHAAFSDAIDAHPEIGWSLWRAMARERALVQEWLLGLGRRQALARTAHLICEIAARFSHGDGLKEVVDFPLTQVELADLLGLSAVHVNRVLQQLRAEGLIDLARGRLAIRDRAKLVATADFDPTYLGGGL
ncbi:MAG TPA: Crp/Fnr family transcriptional regulator [Caulobacteraceae bacterium]|nr:Crp/Fnr family transcriptional regulator [Caulobacteraceae bacterium]